MWAWWDVRSLRSVLRKYSWEDRYKTWVLASHSLGFLRVVLHVLQHCQPPPSQMSDQRAWTTEILDLNLQNEVKWVLRLIRYSMSVMKIWHPSLCPGHLFSTVPYSPRQDILRFQVAEGEIILYTLITVEWLLISWLAYCFLFVINKSWRI